MTGLPPISTDAEARAIMAAGLGRAELEFCRSLIAPLFWDVRAGGDYRVRNGSAFFLNAGEGVFAVTANHVIEGWKRDRTTALGLWLGSERLPVDLDGRNAIIAAHKEIDIATFRISEWEIDSIGNAVLTGYRHAWPPPPPQRKSGVYFGGFPAVEKIRLSRNEISFGASAGGGVASSVSERDVSSLIERSNLIPVLGRGLPPENFDFGGISGGPMLSVIEQNGLRSWSLAGVIHEGPNPSPDAGQAIDGLEIIKARRAHFILPDGTLDVVRWEELAR